MGRISNEYAIDPHIKLGHSLTLPVDSCRHFEMNKIETLGFARESGSHRDFPFDSARIVFNLSFAPPIEFQNVLLRNYNSSFYMPCDTASVKRLEGGKVRIEFGMRRNPLIRRTGIVLLGAAAVFVFVIPFTIKVESRRFSFPFGRYDRY